ncbi:unnamed protein product, partial [Staurois parvus]
INSARHFGLCALPGSVRHRDPLPAVSSKHRSLYGTSVRGPDHVITDWSISDHMNSSKQDVTSDIIAFYV